MKFKRLLLEFADIHLTHMSQFAFQMALDVNHAFYFSLLQS